MLNQNFGHYLLNKGLLTSAQLVESLKYEQSVKVKLGILAVSAGLMTADQVEIIHDLQRINDEKFGILAVSHGYLTFEQMEELLASQDREQLSLVQIMVDHGYLTLTVVEQALTDFRREYSLSGRDNEDENKIIQKLVDFSAAGVNAELLSVYVGLMLRNIVRFLNDTPYLLIQKAELVPTYHVSQKIYGEITFTTGLALPETVLLEIASRFSGECLTTINELAIDSVGEFLNVHNGVFCSSLSNVGLRVDLQPQFVGHGKLCPAGQSFRIGVGTSFGEFELILAI